MEKAPIIDAGKYIRKKYGKVLTTVIVSALAVELIFLYFVFRFPQAMQILFFPVVAVVIAYAILWQKAEDEFFAQFAKVNGFSFQARALPGDLLGSLFFIGHSHVGKDLIEGKFQGIFFALFNYQYTIGGGKNSQTYVYTVFRMHFVSSLPPIFLKPKYCFFGGFTFGSVSQEARERLSLEGDFDKYFDLWTKHDFQIEALQLFTPDFMQKIQDNWKRFSLDFVDDQIYIYASHVISKDEELENMYQLLQYLVEQVTPYAKEVKGDIEALNEYTNK